MHHTLLAALSACAPVLIAPALAGPPPRFIDATDAAGLADLSAARVVLVDLTGDGRPDAVVDRRRIFINTPDPEAPLGLRFIERGATGLPEPAPGDVLVFADLDSDGKADAILARYIDTSKQESPPASADSDTKKPAKAPARTSWFKGNGDGSFAEAREIAAAPAATTSAIAVGDVNLDGRLDLYLGNWYSAYGQSLGAHNNDLLLQRADGDGVTFVRQPLAEDAQAFSEEEDLAGRPTYGVMIAQLLQWAPHAKPESHEQGIVDHGDSAGAPESSAGRTPQLLDLNYGRRANRLWARLPPGGPAEAPVGTDLAPDVGIDGDTIRHGRHPEWLKIVAQRDARFDRPDEKPFRGHGNTFDAAIGDVNNDGQFDLFLAEITHGWAGESSDRSRLLIAQQRKADPLTIFEPSPHSFDRIPPIPPQDQWAEGWFPRWNQGDLFCEFADLNNDGLLDVVLSSGDYPDPAPFDQRLRVYMQQEDGSFVDATPTSGINHVGSQQISIGDVDGDGLLDVLVGQTFNRFTPDMVAAAGGEPRLRLFLNRTRIAAAPPDGAEAANAAGELAPAAITLTLVGDPAHGVSRDALGAIVRLYTSSDGRTSFQSRQLIGIGGHAGKQHQFLIHFGLGSATQADRIEIHWPAATETVTTLPNIKPGHHTVRLAPPDLP